MIRLKTPEEIAVLREGGKIHAKILRILSKKVKAGISTADLNAEAEKLVDEAGCTASFLGYKPEGVKTPYPASLCVSINDEIVHGIPKKDKLLKEGDIVTLDLGLTYKKMITDGAVTVPVGKVNEKTKKLIVVCKEALTAGIKAIKPGAAVGDIGNAISDTAKKYGFKIAEHLAGHGVGYNVHEDPFVPNFGRKGEGPKLLEGMVLAIEPMFCEGNGEIVLEEDGYTYKTKDRHLAVHEEHTVVVTDKGVEVLTKM